jgi:hypothetical protein
MRLEVFLIWSLFFLIEATTPHNFVRKSPKALIDQQLLLHAQHHFPRVANHLADHCHIDDAWKTNTSLPSATVTDTAREWLKSAYRYVYESNAYIDYFHIIIRDNVLHINQTRPYQELFDRHGYIHPALVFLAKLMSYYQLPNVEFFLNCGDLPKKDNPTIFSWVKDASSLDTMWVYWSFLYMDRLPKIKGNSSFVDKKSIAIWRGSPSGLHWNKDEFHQNHRVKLVKICQEHPTLCDAKLVIEDSRLHTISFRNETEAFLGTSLSATRHRLSMEEMCQTYKFLIMLDGHSAPSSRVLAFAFCNSLLLIQQSPWREFWYAGLQPYVHYLPISSSLSNLSMQIQWAQNNSQEVQRIVERMNKYAQSYLTEEASICFMYRQITSYARMSFSHRSYADQIVANFSVRIDHHKKTLTGAQRFEKIMDSLKMKPTK